MSDSADFKDFRIKYTALIVFKALLCLFYSVDRGGLAEIVLSDIKRTS